MLTVYTLSERSAQYASTVASRVRSTRRPYYHFHVSLRHNLSQWLSQGWQLLHCQFAQVEADYSQIRSLSKRLASEWGVVCEEWIGEVKDGEH